MIEDPLRRLSEIKKENPTLGKYKISWRDKDSVERNLHKIIEGVIDIGKMLIAEKRFREPASNREIFQILEENGIFPLEFTPLLDKMIGMRNIIVHGYNRIDDSIVFGVLKKNLADIKKLSGILKKSALE
jgi:uncharacterized protein YutE (UPF0331/DUF86 family)